jgi:hypothetical protein
MRIKKMKLLVSCAKVSYRNFRQGDIMHSHADIAKSGRLFGY